MATIETPDEGQRRTKVGVIESAVSSGIFFLAIDGKSEEEAPHSARTTPPQIYLELYYLPPFRRFLEEFKEIQKIHSYSICYAETERI